MYSKYLKHWLCLTHLELTVVQVVEWEAASADVLVYVHDAPGLIHDVVQSPVLAQLHQDCQRDSL